MAVVQVRHVEVLVLGRLVHVPVRVHRGRRKPRVRVPMVQVVVAVSVDVRQRLVGVPVRVSAAKHQDDGARQDGGRRGLQP